jgi:2,4-dienoyl-CoA reductase-like NADH-dependent reductase (Old Yellow Enzyme family)
VTELHPRYPRVFSPIELGPVALRNRFYMSPHAVPMSIGSKPSDDYIHYNVARVKDDGCSLVILTMTMVGRARAFQPSPHPRENIAAFRALADAMHEADGRIFGEPWYFWGTPGQWQPLSPPAPGLTPSGAQFSAYDKQLATRAVTTREIRGLLEAFRQSVTHLREAGFDGVMLHAAHGALLEQFLSPYFNQRSDAYGGSLQNRMRLLLESLDVARTAVGERMAVGMRLNCDELLRGGLGPDESREILATIARSGLIDFVDLDIAVEPQQLHLGMPTVFVEPHVYRPYVEKVRSAAGDIPVLSVLGRLTSIADAEAAMAAGVCDMAGAARALIAEPDLVRNAYRGREDRSRTCIACNWCLASVYEGAAGCAINPASYRERVWGPEVLVPAPRRSRVIIVGGGPGGLEAARVSALRGHDVSLMEARERLGGAFALWARLPGREAYASAIDWWEREIGRLGIDVRLGTEATAEMILGEQPDAVVLATGARYSREGRGSHRDFAVPGHDRDFVCCPEDLLLGGALPRGKVVVLDNEGLHAAIGVAELLALKGADVELLTPNLAPLSPRVVQLQESRPVMERLRKAGVRISTSCTIAEIGEHAVTVEDVYSDARRTIADVDAVVLATARVSVNPLEAQLEGRVAQLFTIGDALAARMWATASFEAHKFARMIGEPGAPACVFDAYFAEDDPALVPVPGDTPRKPARAPALA